MARRVSYNELALFGREEAISDVDGYSLLTLRGEAVDEKREVDILTLRTHALAVGFECGKLILEDHLAVIEQATDEGGFAVINAAASDETQQRLVLMLFQIGVTVLRDQRGSLIILFIKVSAQQTSPSCFSFSIRAPGQ